MKEIKDKEIKYHHNFLCWLDDAKVKYDTWGSSGPDVLFQDYDILGEFKIEESITAYKSAFKEIQKRTKEEFNIKNFGYFFVLTKKYIRFFKVKDVEWDNPNFEEYIKKFNFEKSTMTLFNNNDTEKDRVIEYIKNNCNKISVDAHMDSVLDLLLSNKLELTIMDAVMIICNLNNKPCYLKNEIVYNAGEDNQYNIVFKDRNDFESVKQELINKYYIKNIENVKNYIKYNYSSHLDDTKKSNFGKYYTPEKIVKVMKEWLSPYITQDTYVLDLACGCGAFIEMFDDCHIIGRDIDQNSIDVLKVLGIANVETDNSLVNIYREKYELSLTDTIVIVGNPPYNDITAKNKRFGTNAKTSTHVEIDADIKTNDYGQCFLKAYARLAPKYICVLHPLSYLIKPANFKKMETFTSKYKLKKASVFSSSIFPDLAKNTEFPVVIALYEQGNMDFNYIKSFKFEILDSENTFILNKFNTIDEIYSGKKYINKYPTKTDSKHILKSDINLYQYNIRDTNSLISSGNLMCLANTDNINYVTVNFSDLYKYAYLNMYKLFFPNHYLIGNLSPLVNIEEYEKNKHLQNLMIIGTILKNSHRLKCFDYTDKDTIVFKKFLINDFKKMAKEYTSEVNFYQIFIDIVENKDVSKEDKIFDKIKEYFIDLRKTYLP